MPNPLPSLNGLRGPLGFGSIISKCWDDPSCCGMMPTATPHYVGTSCDLPRKDAVPQPYVAKYPQLDGGETTLTPQSTLILAIHFGFASITMHTV